jgi:rhamnosyltransferase
MKRIAIYVIHDKDGILDGYRKYYLQELRKVTDCIVAVVNGVLTAESRDELEYLVDDIFVRDNTGSLVYGWIIGIKHIGWDNLYKYDELLMLNDSFFGPFFPLDEMFSIMEKDNADFYGAMKNFEEKEYTSIAGRPLKHGYFRGSICYFYIIRKRLFHSTEFRKYWEQEPVIVEDWDVYFFNEINFYDYVIDAGFRVAAYQSDKLKGVFFDNLTHNMYRLIKDDHIPFARIRPFATDMKYQSLQIHYAKDPRQTMEFIDKHTNYDANLIWDYILRTKRLSDIYGQLQLEYVVPKDSVEKIFLYDENIAVILHIYYEDCVEICVAYCENFPEKTDFYVTTTSEKTKKAILKAFECRNLSCICNIRPNVGVAMSSLWVTYAEVVTSGKYEYICYFHDKKSNYNHFSIIGEQFATRLYENLFGTSEIVKNIINLFEDNPRLGVLGVPLVYHGDYFFTAQNGWQKNYENVMNLSKQLGFKTELDKKNMPIFPAGDMFWFRSPALKKAIGKGLGYDDFDVDYKIDFTFMHAIERIYGLAAQDSGYYYADVINTDNARSDLVNYQYMLYKLMEIVSNNGNFIYNFEIAKQILHKTGEKESLAWHEDNSKKQQDYIEVQKERITELETGLAWHEDNSKKQQDYIEVQKERITELETGLAWHEENIGYQNNRITELEMGLAWHEENDKKQQRYIEIQRRQIMELENMSMHKNLS